MRLTLYVLALLVMVSCLVYGILGSLGTAVSRKFELEDPSVETRISELPKSKLAIGYARFKEVEKQIERQELIFMSLIILPGISLVLVIYFRKRILGKSA